MHLTFFKFRITSKTTYFLRHSVWQLTRGGGGWGAAVCVTVTVQDNTANISIPTVGLEAKTLAFKLQEVHLRPHGLVVGLAILSSVKYMILNIGRKVSES
jgi:hypothetical protein